MNKERLKQIAERIVDEPHEFYMPMWKVSQIELSGLKGFQKTPCGTACCIAGHAAQIAVEEGRLDKDRIPPNSRETERWLEIGMEELDLTGEQAKRLFFPTRLDLCWPVRFYHQYRTALAEGDWEKAACIGAERIKHFIATDGKE